MAERSVALVIHEPGACPLLRSGDRWVFSSGEILKSSTGKLCGNGLCSVFPKLRDILKSLPPSGALPDDYLLCDSPGCDAAFMMEFLAAAAPAAGVTVAKDAVFTRRLERGAQAATAILRKHGPFLTRLPQEVAGDLVNACQMVQYEDGQIILMQGVVGDHLYIVAEGTVEVAKRGDKNNDETVLVTLDPGNCFGEMSILTGEITSAEVRSRGQSKVLCLHKDRLEGLLLRRPVLSREFSKLLAERLKATNTSLQLELNRGIIGKLSMISLVDLVQTLQQSRRTGTLVLNYYGQQARLGFKNGTLFTAVAGEQKGDEAFYKVVCWPDGDFCFEQTEPELKDDEKVETDSMGLLMEGMRRMDEAKSAQAKQVDGQAQPTS